MTAARNSQAGIAQAVTVMTNPSFVSGFFFVALAMSFVPVGSRLTVALVGAGFASIVPILTVIALRNAGVVTDLALRERSGPLCMLRARWFMQSEQPFSSRSGRRGRSGV